MKKIIIMLVILSGFAAVPCAAQEKKINLNADNLNKAMYAIERNKALFSNPEMLKKIASFSGTLKQKPDK